MLEPGKAREENARLTALFLGWDGQAIAIDRVARRDAIDRVAIEIFLYDAESEGEKLELDLCLYAYNQLL